MIALLAWVAAVLGWAALWLAGRGHRHGWLLTAVTSLVWVSVNTGLRLWGAVIAGVVSAVLALRNWRSAPECRCS